MPDDLALPTDHRQLLRQYGASIVEGGVRVRLWGPSLTRIDLVLKGGATRPRESLPGGWWEAFAPGCEAGARHRFRLDDGLEVPDPAARFQEGDLELHPTASWSVVVDPAAYVWRTDAWRGRPWEEAVIYEVHVGTYTNVARCGPWRSISTTWPAWGSRPCS